MLVLSRKVGESLVIGDNVVLTINRISGNRVSIGVEAPREVSIVRGELDRKQVAPAQANRSPMTIPMEIDLDANVSIASDLIR